MDIKTMRATTGRALPIEEPLPADELHVLLSQLRGHIELMISEVEVAAGRQPKEDIPRYCALACVGEARMKMAAEAGAGWPARPATRVAWPAS